LKITLQQAAGNALAIAVQIFYGSMFQVAMSLWPDKSLKISYIYIFHFSRGNSKFKLSTKEEKFLQINADFYILFMRPPLSAPLANMNFQER
jgi:hypothetical protein